MVSDFGGGGAGIVYKCIFVPTIKPCLDKVKYNVTK